MVVTGQSWRDAGLPRTWLPTTTAGVQSLIEGYVRMTLKRNRCPTGGSGSLPAETRVKSECEALPAT